jgi:hypothetical protein
LDGDIDWVNLHRRMGKCGREKEEREMGDRETG